MAGQKVDRYFIPGSLNQHERIKHALEQLNLKNALAMFDFAMNKTAEEDGSYLRFAERLFEIEIEGREEKRAIRGIQKAKFPFYATLDEYDFKAPNLTQINRSQIFNLATCQFINNGQNVIILGPSGVGKTHLSIGLGLEAINKGRETRFIQLKVLLDKIEKADTSQIATMVRDFTAAKLVILDDIGYHDPGKNGREFLFTLVEQRHKRALSTIFVSNHHLSKWEGLFGPDRAMAALDRITAGECEQVLIDGGSYRPGHKIKKSNN